MEQANKSEKAPGSVRNFSREQKWIWLLCAIAGLRVFIYAAAFPFFNPVDEVAHYDMVMRYSRLDIPTRLGNYSAETIPDILRFSSPEFRHDPKEYPNAKIPPPPWLEPSSRPEHDAAWWQAQPNCESSGGPMYYSVAGLWARLGEVLGLPKPQLLYWIRFLNIILDGALVWLGYAASRLIFPERRWARLAVPAMIAFFPQDFYYSIQSDALSPLCFGAAFLGLLRYLQTDLGSRRLAALTGLALAATWLVKTSNVPLVMVAVLAVTIKAATLSKTGHWPRIRGALGALLLCAALPITLWCLWCHHAYGDFTGSSAKIQALGWTGKSWRDWGQHPIFSSYGAWTFWSGLMKTFWRGETHWNHHELSLPAVDAVYWLSALVLPGITVVCLLQKRSGITAAQRRAFWLALATFAAGGTFLVLASLMFNFGYCNYPSPAYPYFTSGRLISGALIPFLLLYVQGFDMAMQPVKQAGARTLALGGLIGLMTVGQFIVLRPVFSSQYNWFHLITIAPNTAAGLLPPPKKCQ
jgi:hypothetical protein